MQTVLPMTTLCSRQARNPDKAMLRVGISIDAADYLTFKVLMPKEERLGKTYEEWRRRRLEEDSRAGVSGKTMTVSPDPEEFRLYCIQIGLAPSYHVLQAFAVKKAQERGPRAREERPDPAQR